MEKNNNGVHSFVSTSKSSSAYNTVNDTSISMCGSSGLGNGVLYHSYGSMKFNMINISHADVNEHCAIYASSGNDDVEITDCIFEHSSSKSDGVIFVTTSGSVVMNDCTIDNITSGGYFMSLKPTGSFYMNDCRINNVTSGGYFISMNTLINCDMNDCLINNVQCGNYFADIQLKKNFSLSNCRMLSVNSTKYITNIVSSGGNITENEVSISDSICKEYAFSFSAPNTIDINRFDAYNITSNSDMIKITNALSSMISNITIKNSTIGGKIVESSSSQSNSAVNCTIENNTISNIAFRFYNTATNSIENCSFLENKCSSSFIYFVSSNLNSIIRNIFRNNNFSSHFVYSSAAMLEIRKCTFVENIGSSADFIYITSSSSSSEIDDCYYYKNYVQACFVNIYSTTNRIVRCNFTENTAADYLLYNYYSGGNYRYLLVERSAIIDNQVQNIFYQYTTAVRCDVRKINGGSIGSPANNVFMDLMPPIFSIMRNVTNSSEIQDNASNFESRIPGISINGFTVYSKYYAITTGFSLSNDEKYYVHDTSFEACSSRAISFLSQSDESFLIIDSVSFTNCSVNKDKGGSVYFSSKGQCVQTRVASVRSSVSSNMYGAHSYTDVTKSSSTMNIVNHTSISDSGNGFLCISPVSIYGGKPQVIGVNISASTAKSHCLLYIDRGNNETHVMYSLFSDCMSSESYGIYFSSSSSYIGRCKFNNITASSNLVNVASNRLLVEYSIFTDIKRCSLFTGSTTIINSITSNVASGVGGAMTSFMTTSTFEIDFQNFSADSDTEYNPIILDFSNVLDDISNYSVLSNFTSQSQGFVFKNDFKYYIHDTTFIKCNEHSITFEATSHRAFLALDTILFSECSNPSSNGGALYFATEGECAQWRVLSTKCNLLSNSNGIHSYVDVSSSFPAKNYFNYSSVEYSGSNSKGNGPIYHQHGSLKFGDSNISNTKGNGYGCLYSAQGNDMISIDHCIFCFNKNVGVHSAEIQTSDGITITNTIFTNNSCSDSAVNINCMTYLDIAKCEFIGLDARGYLFALTGDSSIDIRRCSFTENTCTDYFMKLTGRTNYVGNCSFEGNNAKNYMFGSDSKPCLFEHCKIKQNKGCQVFYNNIVVLRCEVDDDKAYGIGTSAFAHFMTVKPLFNSDQEYKPLKIMSRANSIKSRAVRILMIRALI